MPTKAQIPMAIINAVSMVRNALERIDEKAMRMFSETGNCMCKFKVKKFL